MYRDVTVLIDGGGDLNCWCPTDLAIHAGDLCVVGRFDIQEYGRVAKFEERDGPAPGGREVARLMRRATLQDQSKADENALHRKMAMKTCAKVAERMGLQLRLVRGHYSLDRGVLMVEFTSEERLDLREIARQIGEELHARVELKQLGVRDEAGIIGGMGPCGRQLCCSSWIKRFSSINVKMAKIQGLSLNPTAIGGCCGRLKCCLGFENEAYRELSQHVPPVGSIVQCPGGGAGCVRERNLLRQQVRVCMQDGQVLQYRADEVRDARGGNPRPGGRAEEEPGGEWTAESGSDAKARPPPPPTRRMGNGRGPRQDPRQGQPRR
jgi:cell fate regulator YaaT (PSP1 superfamily)